MIIWLLLLLEKLFIGAPYWLLSVYENKIRIKWRPGTRETQNSNSVRDSRSFKVANSHFIDGDCQQPPVITTECDKHYARLWLSTECGTKHPGGGLYLRRLSHLFQLISSEVRFQRLSLLSWNLQNGQELKDELLQSKGRASTKAQRWNRPWFAQYWRESWVTDVQSLPSSTCRAMFISLRRCYPLNQP